MFIGFDQMHRKYGSTLNKYLCKPDTKPSAKHDCTKSNP